MSRVVRGWGECGACGYQGTLDYRPIPGEDYADPDAEVYLLLSVCPACEQHEHVLLSVEEYRDLTWRATGRDAPG